MEDGQTKRQRKVQGALANKRLAELRATALASTTSELWSGGFVSIGTILVNRTGRGCQRREAKSHRTSVSRSLDRLGN